MRGILDVRLAAEAGGPACGSESDDGDDRQQSEEYHSRDDTIAEHSPGGAVTLILCPGYTTTQYDTNCSNYILSSV